MEATWIKMTGMMPPEYTGHYECSNCRWHGKREIEIDYKFCPNCGSSMSKEKNPTYPCKNCCSPSEQAACCGCPTERAWQKRYGKQERKD